MQWKFSEKLIEKYLRDADTSHIGLFSQYMKIKYTGIPDKIIIIPTPTSHGET